MFNLINFFFKRPKKEMFNSKSDYINTNKTYKVEDFFCLEQNSLSSANKICETYSSDFRIKSKGDKIASDSVMLFYILPLIEELKSRYNNELCITLAICKVVCENKNNDYRVKAYYCESMVIRLASTWEYLFIALSEFLNTNLIVGHDIKDNIINASCHDFNFIKHDNVYKIEATPIEPKKRFVIQDKLRRELKIFKIAHKNKNNTLYKTIKNRYCINDRMQEIFKLYKSPDTRKIIDLRNEILHRRSLGARYTFGPMKLGFGQAVNIDNKGWYPIDKLPAILEKNLFFIRDAILILYEMIFYNDVPNSLENRDKTFWVYTIKCNNCKKNSVIADEHIKIAKKSGVHLICPWCKSEKIDILNKEKVNERFYFANFIDYLEVFLKRT